MATTSITALGGLSLMFMTRLCVAGWEVLPCSKDRRQTDVGDFTFGTLLRLIYIEMYYDVIYTVAVCKKVMSKIHCYDTFQCDQ